MTSPLPLDTIHNRSSEPSLYPVLRLPRDLFNAKHHEPTMDCLLRMHRHIFYQLGGHEHLNDD